MLRFAPPRTDEHSSLHPSFIYIFLFFFQFLPKSVHVKLLSWSSSSGLIPSLELQVPSMVLAHWERRRGGFGGCCPLSHLSALHSTAGRVLPRHSDSKNTFLPALVSPKPLQIQSWLGARYLPCLFYLSCFLMKARTQPLPSTHTCLIGFKNPLFSQLQLCHLPTAHVHGHPKAFPFHREIAASCAGGNGNRLLSKALHRA